MKIIVVIVSVLLLITSAIAFKPYEAGGIRGTITPANAAFHALAVSNKDTAEVSIKLGSFLIPDLAPGTYTVIITPHAPFTGYVNNHVTVTDGSITDLGQIQLSQ